MHFKIGKLTSDSNQGRVITLQGQDASHEEWRKIVGFEGYSVSNHGRVLNDDTGRLLALVVNQRGIVNVGLMKNKVQHKRAVGSLVMHAFLPRHPLPAFNSHINLDGDRTNNRVENLMHRPKWFAIKYHQQFEGPIAYQHPLQETLSKEVYENSRHAAMTHGLLEVEIMVAIMNNTYVWPSYQTYRLYQK